MGIRELRRARQEHLAAQRAKADELLGARTGVGPEFEEAPDGYRWAVSSDAMFPLVCQTCGASVVSTSGVDLHTAWHRGMGQQKAL